jgi:hypothetical protein
MAAGQIVTQRNEVSPTKPINSTSALSGVCAAMGGVSIRILTPGFAELCRQSGYMLTMAHLAYLKSTIGIISVVGMRILKTGHPHDRTELIFPCWFNVLITLTRD